MKSLSQKDKEAITKAAQIAGTQPGELSVWEKLGKYFRDQKASVQPRPSAEHKRPL